MRNVYPFSSYESTYIYQLSLRFVTAIMTLNQAIFNQMFAINIDNPYGKPGHHRSIWSSQLERLKSLKSWSVFRSFMMIFQYTLLILISVHGLNVFFFLTASFQTLQIGQFSNQIQSLMPNLVVYFASTSVFFCQHCFMGLLFPPQFSSPGNDTNCRFHLSKAVYGEFM